MVPGIVAADGNTDPVCAKIRAYPPAYQKQNGRRGHQRPSRMSLWGVVGARATLCRQDRALQRGELGQIGLGPGAGFLVLGVGHVLARILDAASQPFTVDIVDMGR